jgi:hypothetical protein
MKHFLAIILLVWCLDAIASTCSMKSAEHTAQSAEVAFLGIVARVEESTYKPWGACWEHSKERPKCGGKLVTFNVAEKLKGDLGLTATVVSEDGCYCTGQYWTVGSSYLVVAKANTSDSPGQFAAENICGGTGPVEERGPIIERLRTAAGVTANE